MLKCSLIPKSIIIALVVVVSIWIDFNYFSNVRNFNTLAASLFAATASISAIWTACYLLFFQLFKDRYPLRLVEAKTTNSMTDTFFWISCSLILGVLVIAISFGVVCVACLTICSLYTILRIFKGVFESNKSLMVSTHIDGYCQDLSTNIASLNRGEFNKAFQNIRLIFEESIIKEEFLVCQKIIENVGEVFQKFLANSVTMITSGKKQEDVDWLFKQIIDFNIYQIDICEKVSSGLLMEYVTKQNFLNIKTCVETNQYEWFRLYVDAINQEFFSLQRDNREVVSKKIVSIYYSVSRKLIKQNKEEWLKYLVDNFLSLTRELNFIEGNSNLKYCAGLLSNLLIYAMEKEQNTIYSYLFGIFKTFTSVVSRVSEGFSDVKVYYAIVFNSLKETSEDKTREFLDLIFNQEYAMNDDPYWLEFKFYCISELKNTLYRESINEHRIQAILDFVSQKNNYQGFVYLPCFSTDLKDNINNADQLEKICSSLNKIFSRCIIKDNLPAYALFLQELNACFDETIQANKMAQEKLFEVYLVLIYRTSSLVNKQFLELTFDQLSDCLTDLDKRRAISFKLAQVIMSKLADLCRSTIYENKNVTHFIIELLFDFLDKEKGFNCIVSSAEAKKHLYRCLFNIGTDCIENNYEEGLRRVSNALGWLAIHSIEQGTRELTIYILERASELYHIAVKMEISQKTLTFLLTLFTTIGTYCCKTPALTPFLTIILQSTQDADIHSIQTAISLRTSENDIWNELYDNRTNELTKKFLQAFTTFAKQKKVSS